MTTKLEALALDRLLRTARTRKGWTDRPVTEEQLRELAELLKFGPTSSDCCRARFVWITSAEAKSKLVGLAAPGNADKTVGAGHGHHRQRSRFRGENADAVSGARRATPRVLSQRQLAEVTAFRNGSLQGAYPILAARAVGLDCGPMSGFSNDGVDQEFFANTRIKSNFICSIGYGSDQNLFPRNPRLSFEEAGRLCLIAAARPPNRTRLPSP